MDDIDKIMGEIKGIEEGQIGGGGGGKRRDILRRRKKGKVREY